MTGDTSLPALSREAVRELDRRTIEELGIPGVVLMERAALGLRDEILASIQPTTSVCIVAGRGNNGGDGFAVARLLQLAGREVRVLLLFDPDTMKPGDARLNFEVARRFGLALERWNCPESLRLATGEVLVDAVFGTGLSGPVRDAERPFLEQMADRARSGVQTFACDIPSGLDANWGEVLGVAVPADVTVSFVAPKIGFFRGRGPEFTGRIKIVDIGIPKDWIVAASLEEVRD